MGSTAGLSWRCSLWGQQPVRMGLAADPNSSTEPAPTRDQGEVPAVTVFWREMLLLILLNCISRCFLEAANATHWELEWQILRLDLVEEKSTAAAASESGGWLMENELFFSFSSRRNGWSSCGWTLMPCLKLALDLPCLDCCSPLFLWILPASIKKLTSSNYQWHSDIWWWVGSHYKCKGWEIIRIYYHFLLCCNEMWLVDLHCRLQWWVLLTLTGHFMFFFASLVCRNNVWGGCHNLHGYKHHLSDCLKHPQHGWSLWEGCLKAQRIYEQGCYSCQHDIYPTMSRITSPLHCKMVVI